jgi:hypothetical protein
VVETTRTQGKKFGAFNITFIELIPKEDNPTTFEIDPYLYAIAYKKLSQRPFLEY